MQANKTTTVQYMTGDNPLEKNLEKLTSGRISTIIDDEIVVFYTANKMGIADKIKTAGSLSDRNEMVVAFSTKNKRAKEFAKIFDEGIADFLKSNEFKELLKKYNIKEWKY